MAFGRANSAAAVDLRRPPSSEGVAALDPQLDAQIGLVARRIATPIGAPSSPVPPSPSSFTSIHNNISYVSPLEHASHLAYSSPSELPHGNSPWYEDLEALPPTCRDFAQASDKFSTRAVAEASASDVLNDSLESIHLGPPALVGATSSTPLPAHHPRRNPSHLIGINNSLSNLFPSEGHSLSLHSPRPRHRPSNPRTRSVLIRNIPPGVDDDTIRRLLSLSGDLRELGAQQRIRGGRGSVVATFFDLRHASNAVATLDGAFQFGRTLDVRFYTQPRSPPNGSEGSEDSSPRLAPRRDSTAHSPPWPENQGTLVVFGVENNTSADVIRAFFGQIGDVKEIRSTPNKPHHKFVEFFDVRDAHRALHELNKSEFAGKKIKLEVSRAGGKKNNSSRNNTPNGSRNNTPNPNLMDHWRAMRNSPPIPVPMARHVQLPSQAFSPVEASSPSPFSLSHPYSNEASRSMPPLTMPHQRSMDVGNTTGSAGSPAAGFYNGQRPLYTSPHSSMDMNEAVGNTTVRSSPRTQLDISGGLNGWANHPAVYSSPEVAPRMYPDDVGSTLGQNNDIGLCLNGTLDDLLNEGPNRTPGALDRFLNEGNTSSLPFSRKNSLDNGRHGAAQARKPSYSMALRMPVRPTAVNRVRPSSKAATKSPTNNAQFLLDINKVICGQDTRTALMIRNIPNKYNQKMLLTCLEKHRGRYDFFYLPIDFKNKCNVGYAFINFTDTKYIKAFYDEFHATTWPKFNSTKVCEICYARIQTKDALVNHFQNSSLMNEDHKCRPVVFNAEGKQVEFPVGNPRNRRGPSARDSNRLHGHSTRPFSAMGTPKARGRCR